MEEVFQNYKHYTNWISDNWETDRVLDSVIIKNNLVVERKYSCNGEPYRLLTKTEFNIRESENFIKIPTIFDSDDYQDGHRLAEQQLEDY